MASDSMCVLGIDLGTTSVKVTLLRKECGSVISSVSKATKADVVSDVDKGSEQDPTMILDTLKECMAQLSKDHLQQVTCVGVTGQMHGVVLWNSTKSDEWKHLPTSHLYTWQDQRCTTDFLRSLPTPDSHLPLSTGHGCATLCWLHRYKPEMTSAYECSGTIMDLLVALLCGLSVPVTTIQLSASFGFYNTKTRSWNREMYVMHRIRNVHRVKTNRFIMFIDKDLAPSTGLLFPAYWVFTIFNIKVSFTSVYPLYIIINASI